MAASTSMRSHVTSHRVMEEPDALDVSLGQLGRNADGRQTAFETRMAMQRELDAARQKLKNAERSADASRRESVHAREEAAVHRTENLRLQEEIRSLRMRLNAALDTQQDLLQKNASKHEQLVTEQNTASNVRDELASKSSLVTYLQEQNAKLEQELTETRHKLSSAERTMDTKFAAMSDEVGGVRNKLAGAAAEIESLRTTIDALRAELHKRDAEVLQRDTELMTIERELLAERDESKRLHSRAATNNMEIDELRAALHQRDEHIHQLSEDGRFLREQISAKDNLSNQLTADVTAREDMIRSLQDENGQLTSELAGTRHKLDKTSRKLNSQIANLKSREKHLSSNLKSLHKYVGKREREVQEISVPQQSFRGQASSAGGPSVRDYGNPDVTSDYLKLKAERKEVQRREELARQRLRQSLGV